jgi:hypothetical protein
MSQMETDRSGNQSSDRSSGSAGSSGDSGRRDGGVELQRTERGEPNQSKDPGKSEAPKEGANKSEPNKSEAPKKPEAPNHSEGPNQSKEPKPGQSEKPKVEHHSDSGKSVLMTHPFNDGKSHPGRGATGDIGHGLDKEPNAKDWYNKAAQDMKAPAGTKVQAPMGGEVKVDRDKDPKHVGGHFGDTITIKNGDFRVVLMHVDANEGLKTGMTVKAGEDIAKVTHWDSNPNETHLHMATGVKGSDGAVHGVDPGPIINATQGGNGREVTNAGDGKYVVGDQKYSTPTPPPAESRFSQSAREFDDDCFKPK